MTTYASQEEVQFQSCKVCGESLPLSRYRITRWGTRARTCKACCEEKRQETMYNNKIAANLNPVVYDTEFDGKTNQEVIAIMGRAKRWLESRGYEIVLKGQYKEVKIHTLKF